MGYLKCVRLSLKTMAIFSFGDTHTHIHACTTKSRSNPFQSQPTWNHSRIRFVQRICVFYKSIDVYIQSIQLIRCDGFAFFFNLWKVCLLLVDYHLLRYRANILASKWWMYVVEEFKRRAQVKCMYHLTIDRLNDVQWMVCECVSMCDFYAFIVPFRCGMY